MSDWLQVEMLIRTAGEPPPNVVELLRALNDAGFTVGHLTASPAAETLTESMAWLSN